MNIYLTENEYIKMLKNFESEAVYAGDWAKVDNGRLYNDTYSEYLSIQYNGTPNTLLFIAKRATETGHMISLSPFEGELSIEQHNNILKEFMKSNDDIKFKELK